MELVVPTKGDKSKEAGEPQRLRLPKVLLGKKSDGAPALDPKPSSPEAAPSSKEFPAATESPSSMPKVQATTAPAAPSDEVKSETPS